MVALLILALLQSLPSSSSPAPSTIRTLGKGPTSDIESPRQVVARTAAEWQALWSAHAPGGTPAPAVDFAREMVLGVFVGQRPTSGYGVEIVRTLNTNGANGTLIVEYVESKPAPGAITGQVITSPYHLVAVPKHDGEVKFQKADK